MGYDISWAAFNMIEVMSSTKFTYKVWYRENLRNKDILCSKDTDLNTMHSGLPPYSATTVSSILSQYEVATPCLSQKGGTTADTYPTPSSAHRQCLVSPRERVRYSWSNFFSLSQNSGKPIRIGGVTSSNGTLSAASWFCGSC